MASGRIQCLLVAARSGHVVYERFYENFSDSEKAEIRAAFDQTGSEEEARDDQELVGRYKNGRIVVIPSGEVVLYGLGTGEYNELALAEVLRTLTSVYKEAFKVPTLSDAVLFANYAETILVMDEVCKEGLVEHLDRPSIFKAVAFKLPTFGTEADKGRGLMGMFTSKELRPS